MRATTEKEHYKPPCIIFLTELPQHSYFEIPLKHISQTKYYLALKLRKCASNQVITCTGKLERQKGQDLVNICLMEDWRRL